MIPYKQRYQYSFAACVGVMIISVWFDLSPGVLQIKNLNTAVSALKDEIKIHRQRSMQSTSQIALRQSALPSAKLQVMQLAEVFARAHQAGVSITTATMPSGQVVLQGDSDFMQFGQLMALLTAQQPRFSMMDFSFKQTGSQQGALKAHIALGSTLPLQTEKPIPIKQNPFCNAARDSFKLPFITAALHLRYPISEIKMLGTMRDEARLSALVRLPNEAVLVVRVGDMLGKEGGKVAAVTAQSVSVKLSGQGKNQRKTIYL